MVILGCGKFRIEVGWKIGGAREIGLGFEDDRGITLGHAGEISMGALERSIGVLRALENLALFFLTQHR